jgi:hypothetical protein
MRAWPGDPMSFGDVLEFFSGQLPEGRQYAVATSWIDDLSRGTILR